MATLSRDPPSSPSNDHRPHKIAKMEDSIDISEATTAMAWPSVPSSLGTGTPNSRGTPVPSSRPDAKARRYDRQLRLDHQSTNLHHVALLSPDNVVPPHRLWASAGQRSLESARILLVGHDASGCQTLKNLVLPGIAHFTILSNAKALAADVGTNFFLEPSSVGKPIAAEEVRFLCELNPAVQGEAKIADTAELLASDPSFFLGFTLIITSNISPSLEDGIADLLWKTSSTPGEPDIPLLSIRTSGLTGRLQIQLREHCVVDTHPDTTHTLRIDKPFASLESYSRELDMDSMDSMEHSHIPWVVLLVRAGCLWRESHNGQLPRSAEEKAEFKKLLTSWRRKGDEENFDEALSQAYRVWTSSDLPYGTAELLQDPAVTQVSASSKNLHLLLHTLQRFLDLAPNHLGPLSPSLPDMHSSTGSYVTLQNLFKQQHMDDLAQFNGLLAGVLKSVELPVDAIPFSEIETFVKNVSGVAIVKGTALQSAKAYEGGMKERIAEDFQFEAAPTIGICMMLAILASEQFWHTFGRWPGENDGEVEMDVAEVERFASKALGTVHAETGELPEELSNGIAEVVRGGFFTPPTTAALFGGLSAQEVIKLVTNQYRPLDNTAVVDLVKSGIEKFKL